MRDLYILDMIANPPDTTRGINIYIQYAQELNAQKQGSMFQINKPITLFKKSEFVEPNLV